MPRIKFILCSGIFCLFITALTAQVAPKNRTLGNVVGYQIHQQKQWNYNQLPKNSVLYKSDYRHSMYAEKNKSIPLLKIDPAPILAVSNNNSKQKMNFTNSSNSYIQTSRFLNFYYQKQNIHTLFKSYDW